MRQLLETANRSPSWLTVRDWLTSECLPLWANAGFHQDRGAFTERLSLHGQPIRSVPHRLMVQARQLYSYNVAEKHRWMEGAGALVARAARSMVRDYYQADGEDGWVTSVDSAGRILNAARDLYMHAFALLGLAAAFESSSDRRYLHIADATLDFMDAKMAHPAGGYVTSLPMDPSQELTQNPHMHLLEALLALYKVSPRDHYRARSQQLVRMLEQHFFQPETGILAEYFSTDWGPVAGDRGRLFEPGHHYEWVWLLYDYSSTFEQPLPSCTAALLATADRHCSLHEEGLLRSQVRDDGLIFDPAIRLWPHTEALKASLASGRAAYPWLDKIYKVFLQPAYSGTWNDRVTPDGKNAAAFIPASSLYHLVCAFSEYERVHGEPAIHLPAQRLVAELQTNHREPD